VNSDWPALEREVPASYRRYVDAIMRNLKPVPEGKMLPAWRTPQGWMCVQVPFLAVPGYDIVEACKGQGEEAIRKELLLDWLASKGKIVLPEFAPHWHVADHQLDYYPDTPLILGWDMPGCPACSILQVNPYRQVCLLGSLQPKEEESIGVYEFGQLVAERLLREFAAPNDMALRDLQILHYGDPTGSKLIPRPGEAPQEARSCYDILDRGVRMIMGHDKRNQPIYEDRPGWGWRVMPGAVGITDRLEALRARLRMTVGQGLPAFVVCPTAKDAIKALSSYQYKELSEGRYSDFPDKNWASHGVDSIAYPLTRINEQPPKDRDHRAPVREPFQSKAATRSRQR
jgi:hypothetical protein